MAGWYEMNGRIFNALFEKRKVPQDQRSVTDQLNSLINLANQNGMYDAADWLKAKMQSLNINK